MKKKNTKKKSNTVLIIILIAAFLLIFVLGFITGRIYNERTIVYKMCRAFNFLLYLNTENLRHYEDPTFEVDTVPNCEVFAGKSLSPKITYDEWLEQNNLTHIEWKNGTMKL